MSNNSNIPDSKKFETQAVRIQTNRTEFQEHSTPLYLTSSYVFEDAEEMRQSFSGEKSRNIYTRLTNPNTSEFIDKICLLEEAEAGFAFASGMAAIQSTFSALLKQGDHVLSARSIFGSTLVLFNKYFANWGIDTTYFEVNNPDSIESLIQENTKILYIETPTNPAVDILDLEFLSKLCKKHNILFVVDNCFATPYLQQPIKFGADLVIHSATKLIDGQGRVLGGVTVGRKDLIDEVFTYSRSAGPAMSPFNAWVLSKSLETLAVRVERHCQNALALAEFLEKYPKVEWVKYPFLPSHPQYEIAKKQMRLGGSMVSFELKGGLEAGQRFIGNIKMCSLTANLGDTRTIITHPSSTTHSRVSDEDKAIVGITQGMIRCSLGLEHIDDIIGDIENALSFV